ALDRLRTACESGEARRFAVHEWLRRASSLGCGPSPVAPTEPTHEAEAADHAIIHYARLSEDELVVGANGRSFDAPDTAEVLDLLERLARRERVTVEPLAAAPSALLRQLGSAGAIRATARSS